MALFSKGRKDKAGGDTAAEPAATATAAPPDKAKKGGLFGRGGKGRGKESEPAPAAAATAADTTAAVSLDDFADFAAPSAPAEEQAAPHIVQRKPPALKNGSYVGLNVGNDSIKVVELRVKGGELSVAAAGSIPTPPDSIANGVITSVSALAGAIRELLKTSKVTSRRAITSIAGTGALVVRIVEVLKMSDKELIETMKVDADRYIPFPPSEVIMDFKALRDLPADGDNMEVLLAAAQREVVDLHINVLQQAKLDPQGIDVEPLAIARALTLLELLETPKGQTQAVDLDEVSAVLNIGAAGTEITVLRGDLVVFTRTVNIGGKALTEALVNYLGLPESGAERVKREWGDALPPNTVTQPYTEDGSGEDWSDFADTSDATVAMPAATAPAATAGADVFSASDLDAMFEQAGVPGPAAAGASSPPAAPLATDPFDPQFFAQGPQNQGPQGSDPAEPQGQGPADDEEDEKPTAPSFDFSDFTFMDEPAPAATAPAATPPAATSGPETPATTEPSPPAAAGFDFSFDEAAGVSAPAGAIPPSPDTPAATSSDPFDFSGFDYGDQAAAGITPAAPAPGAADVPPTMAPASDAAPTIPTAPVPVPPVPVPPAEGDDDLPTPVPSAYDLSGLDQASTSATSGTGAAAGPGGTADAGSLDLDDIFSQLDQTPPAAASPAAPAAVPVAAAGAAAGASGGSGIDIDDIFSQLEQAPAAAPVVPGELDIGTIGAGLEDDIGGSLAGIEPDTVHSILRPPLEELAREIRRSLEYHASRHPDAVVSRITLVGGGARLKNIDAFLTQMLGIPTVVGNPLLKLPVKAADLPPGLIEENGPAMAVALGLALRGLE